MSDTTLEQTRYDWLDRAACATDGRIEDFFVEAGHVINDEVLNRCRFTCPVREQCITHAYTGLNGGPVAGGYLGGFSLGQRKAMTLEQALERARTERQTHQDGIGSQAG
jgi:hypothetical protein